jgi:hypothetical protein
VAPAYDSLNDLVAGFMTADKVASSELRWRTKGHPDYSECAIPVFCPSIPEINSRLILVAHRSRRPVKYGFSLLAADHRVLGLDVNPGTSHFNVQSLISISVTHWQAWPSMDAVADERDLPHRQWFLHFLSRAKIAYGGAYEPPPFVEPQLKLV